MIFNTSIRNFLFDQLDKSTLFIYSLSVCISMYHFYQTYHDCHDEKIPGFVCDWKLDGAESVRLFDISHVSNFTTIDTVLVQLIAI